MARIATCPLCEASCGILVDTRGEHIHAIRGDQDDPFSRGYICPKAAALADLHEDPDRLRAYASLEETVEMWWRVYVGEQPNHWRLDERRPCFKSTGQSKSRA